MFQERLLRPKVHIGEINPVCSSIGINLSGGTLLLSSVVHLSKASTPTVFLYAADLRLELQRKLFVLQRFEKLVREQGVFHNIVSSRSA